MHSPFKSAPPGLTCRDDIPPALNLPVDGSADPWGADRATLDVNLGSRDKRSKQTEPTQASSYSAVSRLEPHLTSSSAWR